MITIINTTTKEVLQSWIEDHIIAGEVVPVVMAESFSYDWKISNIWNVFSDYVIHELRYNRENCLIIK